MFCTEGLLPCSKKDSVNQSLYQKVKRREASCKKSLRIQNSRRKGSTVSPIESASDRHRPVRSYHPYASSTPNMKDLNGEKRHIRRRVRKYKSDHTKPPVGKVEPSRTVPSPWAEVFGMLDNKDYNKENASDHSINSSVSSLIVTPTTSAMPTLQGQLKLTIKSTNQGLTVLTEKAKMGGSRLKDMDSSLYVQVSVVAKDETLSCFVSRLVDDVNCPVFNEEFSLQLSDRDRQKRVVISVRRMNGSHSQMVGCTSFGVNNLLQKAKCVSGWFYLLNEELGKCKHLHVIESTYMFTRQRAESTHTVTRLGSNPIYLKTDNSHLAVLKRKLSTINFQPENHQTYAPRSQPVAPANHQADTLRSWPVEPAYHQIDPPRSQPVAPANHQADTLRSWPVEPAYHQLDMPRSHSAAPANYQEDTLRSWLVEPANHQADALRSRPVEPAYHQVDPPRSQPAAPANYQVDPPRSQSATPANHQTDTLKSWPVAPANYQVDPPRLQPAKPANHQVDTPRSRPVEPAYHQVDPPRSQSAAPANHQVDPPRPQPAVPAAFEQSTYLSSWLCSSMSTSQTLSSDAYDQSGHFSLTDNKQNMSRFRDNSMMTTVENISRDTGLQLSTKDFEVSNINITKCEKQNTTKPSMSSYSTVLCSTLEDEEQSVFSPNIWQHMQHLLKMEEGYGSQMKYGAQTYSHPLRHRILTSGQHKILFQNVDKLVAISKFHLKRFREICQNTADSTLCEENSLGAIYQAQLRLMCDAYAIYIQGLPNSFMLLEKLMESKDFTQFLQSNISGDIDIFDFINAPVLYIEQLLCYFNSIVLELPTKSQDFAQVVQVVEALHQCLKGNGNSKFGTDSGISCGSTVSGKMCPGSLSSLVSVDSEVAELEGKLVFPNNIKSFTLVTANRHIIFSGDALIVNNWKWVNVQLVLLSDMLLLTQPDGSTRVTVLQEPILLSNITDMVFACFHPCEFGLTVKKPSAASGSCLMSTNLLFRTHRKDERSTWRHLLMIRINKQKSTCL